MRAPSSSYASPSFLRAHDLRAIALPLLQRAGFWQDVENYPGKVRWYVCDNLMMIHRTPFQPIPVSEAAAQAGVCADAQKLVARSYGLDIWWDERKVFSVIWNDGGPLGLVMFKSGIWEEILAHRAHQQTG